MLEVASSEVNSAETAYDTYWRRGWVVVEGVYTIKEAERIATFASDLCERELASAKVASDAADYAVDGRPVPRKLIRPFLKHHDFRSFALDRRLRSLIDRLIGKPVLLADDQVFMKPPRFGSAKPYHQDNAYFLCSPADEVITAWIALDDVDEANGCLRYIDGSHLGPILEHVPVAGEPHNMAPRSEQIDLTREVVACVKKGGVVFHHGKTLHTSHRNESDRWRRAYATHWISRNVTIGSELADEAYFIKFPELYEEALAASMS